MAERVKPYRSGVNYWLLATDPDEPNLGFGNDCEDSTATFPG